MLFTRFIHPSKHGIAACASTNVLYPGFMCTESTSDLRMPETFLSKAHISVYVSLGRLRGPARTISHLDSTATLDDHHRSVSLLSFCPLSDITWVFLTWLMSLLICRRHVKAVPVKMAFLSPLVDPPPSRTRVDNLCLSFVISCLKWNMVCKFVLEIPSPHSGLLYKLPCLNENIYS